MPSVTMQLCVNRELSFPRKPKIVLLFLDWQATVTTAFTDAVPLCIGLTRLAALRPVTLLHISK
jgi:hypothetical protein